LLLGPKVVVDRRLGDLGLARHVTDGDVFIAALGEQAGCGLGDESAGARLFALAQSGAGHHGDHPHHRDLHREMILPDGNVVAPTGKAFDVNFATTAKWDGDLLVEEYVFWDSALQAQQIGLA
jgi:hypothetical protein